MIEKDKDVIKYSNIRNNLLQSWFNTLKTLTLRFEVMIPYELKTRV